MNELISQDCWVLLRHHQGRYVGNFYTGSSFLNSLIFLPLSEIRRRVWAKVSGFFTVRHAATFLPRLIRAPRRATG